MVDVDGYVASCKLASEGEHDRCECLLGLFERDHC